jgi:hypothetical protein
MQAFPRVIAAALGLSACTAGDFQTAVADPPGDALSQTIAECQAQELAPEFDVIRSRISMSVTGVAPAPFMLATTALPTPAERIEIARLGELRDLCAQRILALITVPPFGVSPDLWQQVVQITQQDGQAQHSLMMALARGEMSYGQFEQEETRIKMRRDAAIEPFIRQATAFEQVALAQAEDQNTAAAGAALGEAAVDILDVLDAIANSGAFHGGHHYRQNAGRWHGVSAHAAQPARPTSSYRRPHAG